MQIRPQKLNTTCKELYIKCKISPTLRTTYDLSKSITATWYINQQKQHGLNNDHPSMEKKTIQKVTNS